MPRHRPWISASLLLIVPIAALGQVSAREDAAKLEFFEKKVRPLLVQHCYNCHSANTNSRGGLRVDDRNGLIVGGGRGPALVPGQPAKSLLLHAVRQTQADLKMPPKTRLSDDEIAILTQWIKDGAAWPQVHVPSSLGKDRAKYAKLRKEHWAWQPLRDPSPPSVKASDWCRDDVDRFILAGLEAKGLEPVSDADPGNLLRRLTFDLTGLPPIPAAVDAFVQAWNASQPGARQDLLAREVDRLLATPAFGEHWGRHWLDVARYGESTGSARNLPYPHAWRYRDYVIDAFNADKPYDQFVREQIAGDLLPSTTQKQRDQQLVATGFLALGVRDVNQRFKVRFVMDNIDEQIDTMSRAFLGLTVSCARCHDHKFDPIPITDYYALAGIFQSTDLCAGLRNKMGGGGLDYYDTALLLRLGPNHGPDATVAAKIEATKAALEKARAELLALSEQAPEAGPEREKKLAAARKLVSKIQVELITLSDPALHGPVAYGVRDAKVVGDTEIRIRGEAEMLGPMVPRGFLTVYEVPDAPKVDPSKSGRLELAQWLASPKNPLTPRVMVNRIWQHLFGRGLVASVDNFGVTGDKPSHPDLLDHLAQRFIKNGWSVKKMVRALVLGHTYQLSAATPPAHLAADPDNRLLWRHSPRRLQAEEIRDAMLAAAGTLDLSRPSGSPAQDFKVIELRNDGPEAKRLEEQARASKQRSVYLPLVRGLTSHALEVFDFAEQGMVTGSRDTTTVATQALYLLNDPFVQQQARALADRILSKKDVSDAARVTLAYRLALTRQATAKEVERALRYLDQFESPASQTGQSVDSRVQAWTSFCQALLASAEFRYLR